MPDDDRYPSTPADLHGRISRHVQVSVIGLAVTVLALSMLSVVLRRTPVNDTDLPDADGATDTQSAPA